MPKQIIIAEQHRIAAVFSEDQIQEIIVATGSHQVGDIYLGTVENILPGIDAAFVNIGDSDKNGFMHVSDLGPLKLKRMASSITELLAPQQKVLVQIMKEPTGNKGPRLTGKVSLPGRYLVLMPYGRGVNLSRRIRNEAERNRLRALGILIKPPGMGLLVRTEAEGVSEDAVIEDLEALQKRWEAIQEEAVSTRPPSLLNRDDDFIQRVLRDVYSDEVNRIVTDTESGLERTRKHLSNWSDGRIPAGILIDYHREPTHILEYFRVNAAIREALKPRVDLPSGGYIIIEPTEALTVIDVNSGSFTRSATARETVLWTNCEAATEIARQLRLRNVAGVIVVDFIDMDSRRDQMQVLEQFGKALRADKSRPQISQLSELGLIELTRKRQGQNIYELFGRTCPTCGGIGHLAHLPGDDPGVTTQLSLSARPSSYSSPAQSFSSRPSAREERAVGIGLQSELQELDLLNHPNYQDKNGRGNRRRRRRGSDGTPARGARSTTATPITALRDDEDLERGQRRSRTTRSAEGQLDRQSDRPADELANSPLTPTASSTELSSRSKRGRNGRRRSEEPPEIIAVEMPPAEQRVYAMMGLSPLVFSEQTVKNPQNTLISVVLPGEAEKFMAEALAAAETDAETLVEPATEGVLPKRIIDITPRSKAADGLASTDELVPTADDFDEKPARSAPVKKRRRSSLQPSTPAEMSAEMSTDVAGGPITNGSSNNATGSPRIGNSLGEPMAAPVSSMTNREPSTDAESAEKGSAEKIVRRRRRRSSASE
jgi:ribonuclease E